MERLQQRFGPRLLPAYLRLRRLLPFFSLLTGTVGMIVFQRGFGYIRYVLVYLVLIWLLPVGLALLTRGEAEGPRARVAFQLSTFISQALYQETLFFVLPFYAAASIWPSSQLVFLLLLACAALVATFDPLYERWVVKHRLSSHLFCFFAYFAALNFILPVVAGLPNQLSAPLSAGAAVVISAAMQTPWRRLFRPTGLLALLTSLLLVVASCRFALPYLPPAPLKLVSSTLTTTPVRLDIPPKASVTRIHRSELSRITCYSAIFAPLGLDDTIVHHWRHLSGPESDRIVLSELHGGRKEGFRTWSTKSNFGPHPEGRWTVDIQTEAGQRLGSLSFEVIP